MAQEQSEYYATHGAFTDPKHHRVLLEGLPRDVATLCRMIQGVLIHDDAGLRLYGSPPLSFRRASRETRPVWQRLDAILAAGAAPLCEARQPFERSVGTCRDFSLMLCAMLRAQSVPARLRCGFAAYFHPPTCEDHWICEYWKAEDRRWAIADAQLDDAHRADLSIDFDTSDLPNGQFVHSWQAWRMCRLDAAAAARFGHGDATGAWFVQVNLARDLLALNKRETSPWDSWRDAKSHHRAVDNQAIQHGDRIAASTEAAAGLTPPQPSDSRDHDFPPPPPWQRQ